MDRRFTLFAILVAAHLRGQPAHLFILLRLRRPSKVDAKKAAAAKAEPDKKADAEPATAARAIGKSRRQEPAADRRRRQPRRTRAGNDAGAAAATEPAIAPQWVTLGSADPKDPYRMLVTLTNRGAAVERRRAQQPCAIANSKTAAATWVISAPTMRPDGSGAHGARRGCRHAGRRWRACKSATSSRPSAIRTVAYAPSSSSSAHEKTEPDTDSRIDGRRAMAAKQALTAALDAAGRWRSFARNSKPSRRRSCGRSKHDPLSFLLTIAADRRPNTRRR